VTKSDVINEISEKTGIDKLDVQASVEAFFSVVKNFDGRREKHICEGVW